MDRVDVETNRYLDSQVAAQEADEETIKAMEDAMFEQTETLFDALDSMSNDELMSILRAAKICGEGGNLNEAVGAFIISAILLHVSETVEVQLNK